MSGCSNELRRAGLAYPRTCAICGLGPCKSDRPTTKPADAAELSVRIAETVFPSHFDREQRDALARLLAAFAAEIRRSVVEG